MRRTIQEIESEINTEVLAGLRFTTPGETESARREPYYCSQLSVWHCEECSLVSYGRDCHNNEVETGLI